MKTSYPKTPTKAQMIRSYESAIEKLERAMQLGTGREFKASCARNIRGLKRDIAIIRKGE